MTGSAFGPAVAPNVHHYSSHDRLLRAGLDGWGPPPDAIAVAAARPAHRLSAAADLASELGCLLVALCSGQARSEDLATLAAEWPDLRWIAIDLPAGYDHPLLAFATSAVDDVKAGRLGDLSVKRNVSVLLARLAGWATVMFLDDDIDGITSATARRAMATLERLGRRAVVGLTVCDYPDNSVVCHANRLAGGNQGVFISGSALFLRCQPPYSFFPEIYNEDWLFFFDSLASGSAARVGSARQLRYEPFVDPTRAVAEEFGDVLAEGLVGLLHTSASLSTAKDPLYWRQFLLRRGEFIERTISRLAAMPAAAGRSAAVHALLAAEERRAAITPQSCAAYIRTWRRDGSVWNQRVSELSCLGSVDAALQQLDLRHCTLGGADPPSSPRKDVRMTATHAPEEPPPASVSGVAIDPSTRIATTAQIGAPYRKLLQGEWDRLNRPTTIAGSCDIGHFCVIGEEVLIGENCVLDSFTLIAGGVSIGARVVFNHRASVGAKATIGDDCVIGGLIGERSSVGPSCRVFGDLIHRQLDPTRPWDAAESMEGSPVLEERAFIGWGATVVGGITIGRGSYVCAGATVTKDVPAGQIVTGINDVMAPQDWKGPLGKSDFFRMDVRSGATLRAERRERRLPV